MDTTVSQEDLNTALEQLGMSAEDPELYCALVAGNLQVAAMVDSVDTPASAVEERAWQRPADADNPLGAWYVKTRIEGSAGPRRNVLRYQRLTYPQDFSSLMITPPPG